MFVQNKTPWCTGSSSYRYLMFMLDFYTSLVKSTITRSQVHPMLPKQWGFRQPLYSMKWPDCWESLSIQCYLINIGNQLISTNYYFTIFNHLLLLWNRIITRSTICVRWVHLYDTDVNQYLIQLQNISHKPRKLSIKSLLEQGYVLQQLGALLEEAIFQP